MSVSERCRYDCLVQLKPAEIKCKSKKLTCSVVLLIYGVQTSDMYPNICHFESISSSLSAAANNAGHCSRSTRQQQQRQKQQQHDLQLSDQACGLSRLLTSSLYLSFCTGRLPAKLFVSEQLVAGRDSCPSPLVPHKEGFICLDVNTNGFISVCTHFLKHLCLILIYVLTQLIPAHRQRLAGKICYATHHLAPSDTQF